MKTKRVKKVEMVTMPRYVWDMLTAKPKTEDELRRKIQKMIDDFYKMPTYITPITPSRKK